MSRYLLRNGALISIEVEPWNEDVFTYKKPNGEYIHATLSEQAEYNLLSSWHIV